MVQAIVDVSRSQAYRVGGLVLVGTTAVILAALGFEHIGGYMPCPLCLQQRYAYYIAIPALLVALVVLGANKRTAAAVIFLVVAIAFLANAGLGVYQAGAEWKFWDPPASCAAPTTLPSFDLKQDSLDRIPASCGVASWRFLGLSFAGWNVVASAFLAAGAATAALKAGGLAAGAASR
jgi:disulfide bond formation protein DsbB